METSCLQHCGCSRWKERPTRLLVRIALNANSKNGRYGLSCTYCTNQHMNVLQGNSDWNVSAGNGWRGPCSNISWMRARDADFANLQYPFSWCLIFLYIQLVVLPALSLLIDVSDVSLSCPFSFGMLCCPLAFCSLYAPYFSCIPSCP